MNAEKNLLFAVLTLQLDFVQRGDLIPALADWCTAKDKPLPTFLKDRNAITAEEGALIEQLVEKHLGRHNGDIQLSLSALPASRILQDEVNELGDDFIQETLGSIPSSTMRQSTERTATEETNAPTSNKPAGEAGEGSHETVTAESDSNRQAESSFQIVKLQGTDEGVTTSLATDQQLQREVALKEVQESLADNEQSRSRFLVEAEITGFLEHPGVAPVYALGSNAKGLPFFATRVVKGESLDKAINTFHKVQSAEDWVTGSLELRQLLQQFIAACQTVHYAHSRGVIHRDLHPGNILIGAYGETLVINWGLAKSGKHQTEERLDPLLQQKSSGSTGGIGTAPYMSPEQAGGRLSELDAKSDVYSLGATLYCVLTNQPPYDGKSSAETVKKAAKGEFTLPSERNPGVPPALEAICLKAMTAEPKKRYRTARAIADDLESWLADEPFAVHEESRQEKIGRWIRHHRSASTATAATLVGVATVALLAALLINQARSNAASARNTAVEAQQEAQELAQANKQLAAAEQAQRLEVEEGRSAALQNYRKAHEQFDHWLRFVLGHHEGQAEFSLLDQWPQGNDMRGALLRFAEREYEEMLKYSSSDPLIEFERARVLVDFADLARQLPDEEGEQPKALKLYEQAEAVLEKLGDDVDTRPLVARIAMKKGNTYALRGDFDEAEQFYDTAILDVKKLGPQETTPQLQEVLAETLLNKAALLAAENDNAEAGRLLLESQKLYREVLAENPKDLKVKQNLVTIAGSLGLIRLNEGQHEDGISRFQQALAEQDPDVANSRDVQFLYDRGVLATRFASTLQTLGRVTDAGTYYRRAIDDFIKVSEYAPSVPGFATAVGLTRYNYGKFLRRTYQAQPAGEQLTLSLDMFDALSREFPAVPEYFYNASLVRDELSRLMATEGESQEALLMIEDAVKRLSSLSTQDDRYAANLVISQGELGEQLFQADDLLESDNAFQSAIDEAKKLVATNPQSVSLKEVLAELRNRHAWTLLETDVDRAEVLRDAAMSTWVMVGALDTATPEMLTSAVWNLCFFPLEDRRKTAEAATILSTAESKINDPAELLALKGIISFYRNQHSQAIDALKKSMETRAYSEARDYFFLAMAQKSMKDEDAQKTLEKAVAMMQQERQGDLMLKRLHKEAKSHFAR